MRAISWTMKKKVGRKYIKALSEEKVSVFGLLYFYIFCNIFSRLFLQIETIWCFANHLVLFFSFTIILRKFCSALRNSVFSCTWVPAGCMQTSEDNFSVCSLFQLLWVPWIKLKSSCLFSKCLYLLSHLVGPVL